MKRSQRQQSNWPHPHWIIFGITFCGFIAGTIYLAISNLHSLPALVGAVLGLLGMCLGLLGLPTKKKSEPISAPSPNSQPLSNTVAVNNIPPEAQPPQPQIILPPPRRPLTPANPYKGLNAFTENDACYFFGRDKLIDELATAAETALSGERKDGQQARLLAVIGPSGSGKSSAVRAGLVPRLRDGRDFDSKAWVYLDPVFPGTHPLENLATSLVKQLPARGSNSLLNELRADSRALHLIACELVAPQKHKVVLVVDQLEAVFTLTTSEEERQKFFELLVTAVTEPSGPLCLLLTLRIDFYPQVVRYDKLYQLIDKHHISVLPLTERDDLRKVIEQPANLPKVQLTFERGLVDELLLDMQRQSGALPLLEFTLDQLYQRRDRPDSFLLTWQAYHEMGDIKGALERHADRTFDELPSDEHRQMVHDMFLRLIRPGTTEQEDTIRRRVPLEEFEQADPVQMQKMRETLEAFTSARLLTKDQIDGITTIAVSHETLIREWKRLAGWVRESRDDILFQQSLSEDVAEWERHGKPRDRLYPRSKLKEAQAWARRNTPNSNEETFLHASAKRRMQFIVSIVGIVLLLLSTAGIAVWLSLHQQPDPTLVTTLQDGGIGSLRWAIDTAPSGSTITFDQHLWNQITTLTADLVIAKKRLSIRGPDTGRITINNSTYQVHVGVGASISIFSLAFTNDKSNPPCILLNDGVLTLTNSTVSGNTVSGCTVPSGGSIYNNGGKLALINSMVSVNTASSGSGGIVNDGGTLILTNSIVSNNAGSGSFGGGIENSGGTLMLTNSTISGNTNSGGGGIANFNGDVMLIKSTVSNNTASSGSGGGGIENVRLGMLTLTNSIISGNMAASSGSNGGGIENLGNEVTLTNSIVSGNMAAGDGGGIANDTGTLMLTNSSVSNNTASDGGGIRNFGDTRLINSTVSDNTASRTGGGIFDNGGNVEIAFCTLYGNAAIKGGGLFAQDIPDYQQSASLVARNSLIAGNHASIDSDVAGNFISEGYNLIQIASDITLQRSDLSGNPNIDPKLQQNGGPTQTHALLRGSPAIDAIPLAACHITVNGIIITTDQRGIKRPQGSACDIGAYEYVP